MSRPDELCDRTIDLLGLDDVHRWVVIKTARLQNVAEHSYNVSVIAMEIAERLGVGKVSYVMCEVLRWAIMHDAPETYTGDIDGKLKREHTPVYEAIKKAERIAFPWYAAEDESIPILARIIVKTADTIEAATFIKQWGVGERAAHVYIELENIVFNQRIGELYEVSSHSMEYLHEVVHKVFHQSVHERNSIQMRPMRDSLTIRKAGATGT